MFWRADNLALAFGILTERDHTIDFTDGGNFLRLSSFKKLGHTWKTSGDVLSLRGFTRNLRNGIAREEFIAVENGDVSTQRQLIGRFWILLLVQDHNARS